VNTNNRYGVIVADPFLHNRTDKEIEDFAKMLIPDISTDDCILLLWTPLTYLQDALYLITEWDYTYYNAFAYRKGSNWNKGRYDLLLISFPKNYTTELASQLTKSLLSELANERTDQPVYTVSDHLFPERRKLKLFIHNPRPNWDEWSD
jgi:N6-adenosine-specific RNA methylase IME4